MYGNTVNVVALLNVSGSWRQSRRKHHTSVSTLPARLQLTSKNATWLCCRRKYCDRAMSIRRRFEVVWTRLKHTPEVSVDATSAVYSFVNKKYVIHFSHYWDTNRCHVEVPSRWNFDVPTSVFSCGVFCAYFILRFAFQSIAQLCIECSSLVSSFFLVTNQSRYEKNQNKISHSVP